MSTSIALPETDEACAYCGARIFAHDPLCVRDCADDCGSPTYFCNYACLAAFIEAERLTEGNSCVWDPTGNETN